MLPFTNILATVPLLVIQATPAPSAAPEAAPAPVPTVVRDWLVLAPVDSRGRRPFKPEAVFAQYLLRPRSAPPVAGDPVRGQETEAAWTERSAGEDGFVGGERFSWAYTSLEREADVVLLAELSGAAQLFVNGEAFVGDVYRYGFGGVPVVLGKGRNDLFVTGVRGGFRLRLKDPRAPLMFAEWDRTLPDLTEDWRKGFWFALPLLNASEDWQVKSIRASWGDGTPKLGFSESEPFRLAPLALRKPAIQWADPGSYDPVYGQLYLPFPSIEYRGGPIRLRCEVGDAFPPMQRVDDPVIIDDAALVEFRRASVGAKRVETFFSRLDSSVQELGVIPPSSTSSEQLPAQDLGLVLSLHGASVACRNQVGAYSQHDGYWIFVPTNRRPFGFDWQDWGRDDVYEVLGIALGRTGTSPDRVYLTGHSMGGHGTWHVGANDPDTFAALAPSAGWESFDSYVGRPEDELAELWQDADAPSRTLRLIDNLVQLPTYVVHGTADDNVPPSEAELLLAALREAGAEPRVHMQEGAGHWWDGDAAEGADCVDWPGIFELFDEVRRPHLPSELDFTTVDPAVDDRHYWLRVQQPLEYGRASRVRARIEVERRLLTITTENVRNLCFEYPWEEGPLRVVIDAETLDAEPLEGERWLHRAEGAWTLAKAGPSGKSPHRSGPFKRAFGRDFVLVCGTGGDDAMDAALLARARYDAQQWWYRGNGDVEIVRDEDYLARRKAFRESPPWNPSTLLPADLTADPPVVAEELLRSPQNVILYGNRVTNHAWTACVPASCPVDVRPGEVRLGDKVWNGDDLCCTFVYPRGGGGLLVGAFANTGIEGARLGNTFGTFIAGAGFPDLALVSSEVLTKGDAGVRAAGWFEHDWTWSGGRLERGYVEADGEGR